MKDPLELREETARKKFDEVYRLMVGLPVQLVWDVCLNLMVNTIRQSVGKRSDAEAIFNELFGRAKTTLLDVHYDSVTGQRRGVFPHTQVVQMPFLNGGSTIFHGK